MRVTSKNRPGHYWGVDEGIEGYLMTEPEMFTVVSPGLWGAGSVSFQSTTRPGRYLRHRDGRVWVEEGDTTSALFQRECSWFARQDHFFTGFMAFESVHMPGFFIRHNSRRLELTEIASNKDRNDASFAMSALGEAVVETEERWRGLLGETVEVESKAVPGHYWAAGAGGSAARLELQSTVFKMVPGLWGEDTVSFQSASRPELYLRSRAGKVWVEAVNTAEEAARQECSFNPRDSRFFAGYTAFEAAGQADQWIRQSDREMRLSGVSGYRDTNDASFLLSGAAVRATSPAPTPRRRPPTTRRTTTATTTTTTTTAARVFEARRPSKWVPRQSRR